MKREKAIEIPFGAKDSELIKWEYTIPEGMEAEIKDGKVIIKKAESEDEKIRKAIIKSIEEDSSVYEQEVSKEQMLAWLEKQKEQKPAEQKVSRSQIHHELLQNGTITMEEYLKLTENLYFPRKQRQGWDEFDEDCLKRAIWYIENPAPSVVKDTNLVLWLKSLPERFNLQPKAELTLLDENIIKAAVAFVEQNNHFNYWGGIDKHTVINALRSLRPSWKPSEEQMEAFSSYIKDFQEKAEAAVGGWNNFDVMIRLYEQLKKL